MQGPSATQLVFVAGAFKEQAAIENVVRELKALGLRGDDIGVGGLGASAERARTLAADLEIRPDIDPEDPLAGAPGLASASSGAASIDRGAAIGGAAGGAVGLGISFIPAISTLIAADPASRVLADVLLFFILGALAGATLGGALAPQLSTHAGFRIVDELEHGALAVVAKAAPDQAAAVTTSLATAGGLHVLRVPGE